MVTLKDLARITKVDISTVSRALNNSDMVHPKTRERIILTAQKLSYQPNLIAQGLKLKRTRTIALLLPSFELSVFSSVATGVEAAAKKHDYTVIFCNTMDDGIIESGYVDKFKNRFIDGFICAPASSNSTIVKVLKNDKIPLVLTVRTAGKTTDAFGLNYFKAAYDATIYLMEKGCSNIALINGSLKANPFKERYDGFLQALSDRDIVPDRNKIFNAGDSSLQNGFDGMMRLLNSNNKIDGVLASTDVLAIGAIRAIRKQGLKILDRY